MIKEHSKWLDYCINFKCSSRGLVLDLACGKGRNAIYLAKKGYQVLAVDNDKEKLSCFNFSNITKLVKNVEDKKSWPLNKLKFDIVLVVNFLNRNIFPQIVDSVKNNGYLIYETFSEGHEKLGIPKNKNFILKPYELIKLCDKLKLISHETIWNQTSEKKYIKQFILCKNV